MEELEKSVRTVTAYHGHILTQCGVTVRELLALVQVGRRPNLMKTLLERNGSIDNVTSNIGFCGTIELI
jgi:hypothetical protein